MTLSEAQKQWGQWKYFVMSRSQKEYENLRSLFSGNQWSEEKQIIFQEALKRTEISAPALGSLRNAYQHVWGYFKQVATKEERQLFEQSLFQLSLEKDEVLPFLQQLTKKYQIGYLLSSKLLFDDKND